MQWDCHVAVKLHQIKLIAIRVEFISVHNLILNCFVGQDDRKQQTESREDEGMGTADIKYGDSLVFLQHMKTGLWLSYQTFETKKRGVGRVEEKKVIIVQSCSVPIFGAVLSRSSRVQN
jgi:hypothetical protein